jgi:hypothetical protein
MQVCGRALLQLLVGLCAGIAGSTREGVGWEENVRGASLAGAL